jgi:hypothetical protein
LVEKLFGVERSEEEWEGEEERVGPSMLWAHKVSCGFFCLNWLYVLVIVGTYLRVLVVVLVFGTAQGDDHFDLRLYLFKL